MKEQIMLDLLSEWQNNMPVNDTEPPMSLENQAKYLSKKYDTGIHTVEMTRYNPSTEETEKQEEDRCLVRFKNVVCKYRPHLHLGDYWLDIDIVDGSPNYKFYWISESAEGDHILMNATHPHLNGGIPCLGNFQGDLATNLANSNFIQFFSVMKLYLSSYNGRSTYVRGSEFRKITYKYMLHSTGQIKDIFSEGGEDIDPIMVGTDPTRWNWPKQLTAIGDLIIEGQLRRGLFEWFRQTKYPYLRNARSFHFEQIHWDESTDNYNKVLGYVYVAHTIGEMEITQAFEFVRIFLLSLHAQYYGSMDLETKKTLRKLASDCYNVSDRGQFYVNPRYTISLDAQNRDEITALTKKLRIFRTEDDEGVFIQDLKWCGDKFSNFMILLRKQSPDKAAASVYCTKTYGDVDVAGHKQTYNKVKKFAYKLALTQLEKDRRKFINELNRPEIDNIITDDGQGTLFSQNL